MWQLSSDNAVEWMRQVGLLGDEPAHVEVLSGGVSGVVLRVTHGSQRLVLKQACPQLRTREAWFSDPQRIFREMDVMELLCPLLPDDSIPRLIHADRERFVLAMQHAPEEAMPWKSQLLAGQIESEGGRQAGTLLASIHQETARRRGSLGHLAERTVFDQLRIDPFYRRIQERHADLAPLIEPLIDGMLTRQDALCHGDFSPKNLLVHSRGMTLVDHETAHLGDPAMDVGFFFSHLMLKALAQARSPESWHRWKTLIDNSLTAYFGHIDRYDLEQRSINHLAVCMLARVDGTSPVNYLPDERTRAAVRSLGRGLLLDRVANFPAALDRLAQATTALSRPLE